LEFSFPITQSLFWIIFRLLFLNPRARRCMHLSLSLSLLLSLLLSLFLFPCNSQ
jgi:hypothetical protein